MSELLFTGCLHFGHESMMKNLYGYESSEKRDQDLIEAWNKQVSKRDRVYVLGDVTMESRKHISKLGELNGLITVVLGNHDCPKLVGDILKYAHSVSGPISQTIRGVRLIASHIPIHESELEYTQLNVHAHIHQNVIEDLRYYHAGIETNKWRPVTMEDIHARVEQIKELEN